MRKILLFFKKTSTITMLFQYNFVLDVIKNDSFLHQLIVGKSIYHKKYVCLFTKFLFQISPSIFPRLYNQHR